jgi:hypothetical protein
LDSNFVVWLGVFALLIGFLLASEAKPTSQPHRRYPSSSLLRSLWIAPVAAAEVAPSQPVQPAQAVVVAQSTQCDRLGVSTNFCQALRREVLQHSYRWGNLPSEQVIGRLYGLRRQVRSKLGSFEPPHGSTLQYQLQQSLDLSHGNIDRLADRRFARLFPEREYGQIHSSEAVAIQLWWAIREDELLSVHRQIARRTQ